MTKKHKTLLTRIFSGFLCLILLLGIIAPLTYAQNTISGKASIDIDLNNWQKKVSTYVYTVSNSPGEWDVLYGLGNGSNAEYLRIPQAIEKIEDQNLQDTFVYGLTFYKISSHQIAVVIDHSYVNSNYSPMYKIRIVNGSSTMDVEINCTYGDNDTIYSYGSQIYMTSQVIEATSPGVNYFTPLNGFKNSRNNGVENDGISGAVTNPSSGGLTVLKYRDFISETERNFGYVWPINVKGNYHLNDDYYYLVKTDYTADGTYIVSFNMSSGPSITKNIIVNAGTIPYEAEVSLDYQTTSINIPTQTEGTLRIPININIYQGELLQTNLPYKVVCSPIANGIKIENNQLVIEPTAIAGNYTIKVLAASSSTVYGQTSFTLNRIQSDYITINCADSLVIPASGTTTTMLTASVFINGNYNVNETVKWELGSFYNGIRIDGNKLIISSDARASTISIVARLNSNTNIFSRKTIVLTEPDITLKPDAIKYTGITNDTWEPAYPYGRTLQIGLYAMNGNVRNDNVELGLRLKNPIEGVQVVRGGDYNSFELMANGVYNLQYIDLVAYAVNHPDVTENIRLRVAPEIEGTVFSNSSIVKGGTIEANGSLIINSTRKVDAIMLIAVYKDNKLVSVTPQTSKETQSGNDSSMTVFSGSVKLPKDISGVTVKIMLMRGTSPSDATELLAEPLVIK